jgi:hypothetical protein
MPHVAPTCLSTQSAVKNPVVLPICSQSSASLRLASVADLSMIVSLAGAKRSRVNEAK